MEHRFILTPTEANEFVTLMEILDTSYVIDTYDGEKRIRKTNGGITEKEYKTPVTGIISRISIKCRYKNFDNVYFETKWTDEKIRIEVEFEDGTPPEYADKPNIPGWDILLN